MNLVFTQTIHHRRAGTAVKEIKQGSGRSGRNRRKPGQDRNPLAEKCSLPPAAYLNINKEELINRAAYTRKGITVTASMGNQRARHLRHRRRYRHEHAGSSAAHMGISRGQCLWRPGNHGT